MIFTGIMRGFSLAGEGQYETIGAFWDEMAGIYGLENLRGLGYKWSGGVIYYAIGLADGEIAGWNFRAELPDGGWTTVTGRTDGLKEIYDRIYTDGPLTYEIETFFENGDCRIEYYR